MPVTAKFSQEFYDRLGHRIADELVNWFNQVDATYRNDLRELNELNFARFDAKLEQRISQLDAKLEQRIAEVRGELAMLEGRLLARIGVLEGRFGVLEGRLIRWLFVFWVGTIGTLIALQQR
jgi:hypothetical protein